MNHTPLINNLKSLICGDDFNPMLLLTLAYQLYHIKESEAHNQGIKKNLKSPQEFNFRNSVELWPLPHNPTYLQLGYGIVESRLKSSIDPDDEITNIKISHTLNDNMSLMKIEGSLCTKIEMFS